MAYFLPGDFNNISSQNWGVSSIHFNARSLPKSHDRITALLASLNHQFSAICCSETWLSPGHGDLYGFPGYVSEYAHRTDDRHGGSAIFISNNILYKRRNDLNLNVAKCESLWLEIDLPGLCQNQQKTILATVYRSPSSDPSAFCNALHHLHDKLTAERKNIKIMGDMNFDLLDSSNHSALEYNTCFHSFVFKSLISVPTRCSDNGSRSSIDHILTNIDDVSHAGVIESDITDHFPVFLYFEQVITRSNIIRQKYRFDSDKYCNACSLPMKIGPVYMPRMILKRP